MPAILILAAVGVLAVSAAVTLAHWRSVEYAGGL
jgi:hypothetical protein